MPPTSGVPPARLAIIAGSGQFPFYVAREAKRQGRTVIGLGIQGWADASLAAQVDAYEEIAVGQVGTLLARLKSHRVGQAIMAGKVTKDILLTAQATADAQWHSLLRGVRDLSVNGLLGALAQRLEGEGIHLVDSSIFLQDQLCPHGVLTARGPTAAENEDVRVGIQAARQLAALDIGQTVVVKGRVIIALEALEGTDVAIRRAHALAGSGLVVVKMASPFQDRRFDLPVIGPDTIETLRESGVSCLAAEAQMTLLLDRGALIASANVAGLCLLGVSPAAPSEPTA